MSGKVVLLAGVPLLRVTQVIAAWRRLDELITDPEQNAVPMGMKSGASAFSARFTSKY